jgi:hypothetical protein
MQWYLCDEKTAKALSSFHPIPSKAPTPHYHTIAGVDTAEHKLHCFGDPSRMQVGLMGVTCRPCIIRKVRAVDFQRGPRTWLGSPADSTTKHTIPPLLPFLRRNTTQTPPSISSLNTYPNQHPPLTKPTIPTPLLIKPP